MALRRKQQRLLGFGPRWQSADPSQAVRREREVSDALGSLQEVYVQQRRVQDLAAAECAAEYPYFCCESKLPRARLFQRRGQAVSSFGRRLAGEWILDPEEVLYLAERGTLAVYTALLRTGLAAPRTTMSERVSSETICTTLSNVVGVDKNLERSAGCGSSLRRVGIPELYHMILGRGIISPRAYLVFSYLRRVGGEVARAPSQSYELGLQPDGIALLGGSLSTPAQDRCAATIRDTWICLDNVSAADSSSLNNSACSYCRHCWALGKEARSAGVSDKFDRSSVEPFPLMHVVGPEQKFSETLACHVCDFRQVPSDCDVLLQIQQPCLFAVSDNFGSNGDGCPCFIEVDLPLRPGLTECSDRFARRGGMRPASETNLRDDGNQGSDVGNEASARMSRSVHQASAPSPKFSKDSDEDLTCIPKHFVGESSTLPLNDKSSCDQRAANAAIASSSNSVIAAGPAIDASAAQDFYKAMRDNISRLQRCRPDTSVEDRDRIKVSRIQL